MDNFCIDCGKKIDIRSKRCHACANRTPAARERMRQCKLPGWKRKIYYCFDCGKELSSPNKRCHECHSIWQRSQKHSDVTRKGLAAFKQTLGYTIWLQKQSDGAQERWEGEMGTKVRANRKSKEYREKQSKSTKEAWKTGKRTSHWTPELSLRQAEKIKEAHERGCYENVSVTPSKLEILVANTLLDIGLEYQSQFKIDGRFYDFYLPEFHTLVEVDGEYWHHSRWAEQIGQVEIDKEKNFIAHFYNFNLIRVREKDIVELGAEQALRESLQDLI